MPGFKTEVLTYQAPATEKSYIRVRFLPSNYGNCDSIFSNIGLIESDTSNLISLVLSSPADTLCLGSVSKMTLVLKSLINLPDAITYKYEIKKDTGIWQLLSETRDTAVLYTADGLGNYAFRVSMEIIGITCNRLFSNEIKWNVGETSIVALPYREINLCFGSPFNLTPTINRSGVGRPDFQWQQRKDFSDWTDLPGATSLSYNGNDTINGAVYYRLKYLNAGIGCSPFFTDSVLVRKKGNTIVRIGASTLNPCTGASVILAANTLQPETEPFSSAWQESNDSISWKTIGSNSFNYSLTWNQNTPKYFRFIYQSRVSGCDSSFSNVLKLVTKAGIIATIRTGNNILCKGDTLIREANITGITGTQGLQWQWSKDGNRWNVINGATGLRLRWVPDSTGTIFLRIKVWDNPISCDTSYSARQEINIFDNPEIKIIPASGTFCQGQPILLTAQLSG